MKLNEVFSKLEEIAPVALSDEFCKAYGLYDNSGVIIDCGNEVCGALFSLDLTLQSFAEAKRRGFNLIVTHHPAIYGGITRLNAVSDPQARAISECLKSGISVISMHLNFDAAPQGIDYFLMKGLGGKDAEILFPLSNGGYGRCYGVESKTFSEFVKNAKAEFCSDKLIAYGAADKIIKKAASFCGAGCDDKAIAFAQKSGADAFISGDMKHHEITALLERGINVLHMTHYASENYGFKKIYSKIKEGLNLPSAYFDDERM